MPLSQFEPLCSIYILLYRSCTIQVKYKVSDIYFVTNCFPCFSHKSSDCCALAPPSINILLISNHHSVLYPHNLPPFNDYGSHVSLQSLIPPSLWRGGGYVISYSQRDTGLFGRWFMGTHVSWKQIRGRIRWYITTHAPSLPPLPQLGKFSCSLFYDILTPNYFNLQCDFSILDVV